MKFPCRPLSLNPSASRREISKSPHGKDRNVIQVGTENSGQGRSGESGRCLESEEFELAIVGGGFSGLCTAWHLLTSDEVRPAFRCAIVEPGERLGAGLAYRTDSPCHLLNVRARGMSITAGDPGSFVRWLSEAAPDYTPDDFVPRCLYRRYITGCLERALEQRPPGALTVLRDEVRSVIPKAGSRGYLLRLESGGAIHARTVVLAIGNLPPTPTMDNGLLCSPWHRAVDYRRITTLAIVGAGLTALDIILDAEETGFSGRYWVISPHGQFPRSHREPFIPVPAELRQWAEELASSRPTLRQALRAFQQKRKSGVHWEHLVDALRRFASDIWRGFDAADKRLFLRRLRSFWNTHLHRSCQRSIQVVSRLMDGGRLEQIHARVIAVEKRAGSGDSAVRLVLKSNMVSTLDVDAAVNATGLFSTILKTDSALVAQLLDDGLVQPDAFSLGLRVNGAGQLLSPDGTVHPDLFTVGTLRRGEELECTAVPEIRRQVAAMVEEIVGVVGAAEEP
jgi:uncharacterized NAD(P)/FAD-binding protein YdhS